VTAPERWASTLVEGHARRTIWGEFQPGPRCNLGGSWRFDGKVGGHFVSGHIDGCGTIEIFEARGQDHYLRVKTPDGGGRYIVHKGSIAIDGVSLTVAEVSGDSLAVWLIPHTLNVTNLGEKKVGQRVNLEYDLLGKYVEKLTVGLRA